MLRFRAPNIVTSPWDFSHGCKALYLSAWIYLLLPLLAVSFTQFSPRACPSSIQPTIHLFIFLPIKFCNCLYLFLYGRFSVDFCVGSCLDTCLPFLDQFPLFFKHLKAGSNISLWDFFSAWIGIHAHLRLIVFFFYVRKEALSAVLSLQFWSYILKVQDSKGHILQVLKGLSLIRTS